MKRIVEFTESFFAILAIIGTVTISTAAVIALNPKEYTQDVGDVAGAESLQQTNISAMIPLLVESPMPQNLDFDESAQIYTYSATVDFSDELKYRTDFVKITNPNDSDAKVLLRTKLLAPVVPVQTFSIKLLDYLDTIILVEKGKGPVERFATIPANSSRTFELEFESDIRVNYPFAAEIEIN